MNRRSALRLVSLTLAWLIAASLFIAVPRAEATTLPGQRHTASELVNATPAALAGGDVASGFAVSSFGSAQGVLALAQPAGTPCVYTDPDTGTDHDGTIEVRQVGGDHNNYDNDGNFNDRDDDVIDVFARDHNVVLTTSPGYRYELDVCVSNAWPREPLEANWHGAPYETVLAENAVEWFNTVRDAAYEDAFKDKTPGWRIWPDRGHKQIVALESWLFIENFYGTLGSSKVLDSSAGDAIQVQVEAVPTRSEWWTKETATGVEDQFTCDVAGGQGIAWTPGASGANCSLEWEHSSPVIGEVEVRVRLIYDVTISSTTLSDDAANNAAGQVFSQFLPDVPGQWDVAEDGNVPDNYKLYVSEVLSHGFDATGEAPTSNPGAALGATPGGPQVGVSSGCWGPDVVCRVVSNVAGEILDFIVPEEVRALLSGCVDGAVNAAVGFGELLSNLDPRTWDDKIAEMNELKNVLLEAHEAGELLDVLTDMGLQAGFDSLRLDIFDTVGDGNFSDLDFNNTVAWGEWIGAVGCEYLIGLFTGRAQQQLNDLLFNTRNRNNRSDDDDLDRSEDEADHDDDDADRSEDEADHDDDDADDRPAVCGLDSFLTGTPVLMANGTHRAIELIEPGDHVLAYDTVAAQWRPQLVVDQWSAIDHGHMSQVTIDDGSTMIATDHHLFWVESEQSWTTISDLTAGDTLLTPKGTVTVATSVTGPVASTLVWELTVENDHNFTVHAGGHDLLVHNADNGACGPRIATDEYVDDDGNLVVEWDDGTVETLLTDGSTRTEFPDGSMTHVDGAGNTFELDGEDGSFSYTDPDGNDVPLHLPDGRPVLDTNGRPIGEMTGDIDPDLGIDRAWLDENGNERYPPNNGTIDGERTEFLEAGDVVDRYGPGRNGSYLGDPADPLDVRGIAPDHNGDPKPLWTYESNVGAEVLVDGTPVAVPPMPVNAGEIAPWNGSPGGATQYRTDADLITQTYGPGTQAGGGAHPLFDQMIQGGRPNNDFWFTIDQAS